MRGKVRAVRQLIDGAGITPAHAEKSARKMGRAGLCGDHPRPCGEKARGSGTHSVTLGSPPPMRGKVNAISSPGRKPGITPAHAGKRQRSCRKACASRDHPRPCGEKMTRYMADLRYSGSPPPMRGKAMLYCAFSGGQRITPAHAGKSDPYYSARGGNGDHPRPCGEKIVRWATAASWAGSPPPMRGKGARPEPDKGISRITPAHAGKSDPYYSARGGNGDHPRPCGEKLTRTCQIALVQGSPPPMRGKAQCLAQ